jgi:hypothetical protein
MVNNTLYLKVNQAKIGQCSSSFVGSDIPYNSKGYILHYKVYNCAHTPTALIKNCNESPPLNPNTFTDYSSLFDESIRSLFSLITST